MSKEIQIQISKLLGTAARTNRTCTFLQVFSLFSKGTKPAVVYQALDDAAKSIVRPEVANYSSLMAKRDTGCPGDGFFDTFKIKRRSEYDDIAGVATLTLELTTEQKKAMTALERVRVYAHAAGNVE